MTMPDWVDTATVWARGNLPLVITGGSILAMVVLSIVAVQIWAAYRGHSLNARASLLFAVVQTGVAYVTITGVYGFWHDRVGMPTPEAALIATFIEAVTWAAVSMIFAHGSDLATVGLGDAGQLFWISVVGGGIMAVVGSGSIPIALGRSVVVVLGGAMWHLRIRARTRRVTTRRPTQWTITPRQWVIRRGWLIADDTDVVQSPRQWQEMTLARAVRHAATGRGPVRWSGKRAIQRVMESGDVDMVRAAQQRYALAKVLQDDLADDSPAMAAAIEAARDALYPQPVADRPTPEPLPEPSGDGPPDTAGQPDTRPRKRTKPRANPRTAAAIAARADRVAAAELKQRATAEAVEVLRAGGDAPTGKDWGARYGNGEEWGRQRLIDARRLLDDLPAVNGHAPAATG